MRCSRCGSLETKRNGKSGSAPTGRAGPIKPLQRFLCMQCGASFTFERKTARPRARFTDDVVEEAVRLYVQGLSSYRVLAVMLEQRFDRPLSRFTLNGWVQELAERAKTPLEVSIELQPKWGGFLGIDEWRQVPAPVSAPPATLYPNSASERFRQSETARPERERRERSERAQRYSREWREHREHFRSDTPHSV